VSLGLISGDSSCSELIMAPLSGDDFDSLFECFRGGLMEIRDEGGVESNSEKRRNMIEVVYLLSVVGGEMVKGLKRWKTMGSSMELWWKIQLKLSFSIFQEVLRTSEAFSGKKSFKKDFNASKSSLKKR
jgi:hypothetical protein